MAGVSVGLGTVPESRGVCKLKHCWPKRLQRISWIVVRNLASQSENCITCLMSAIYAAVSVLAVHLPVHHGVIMRCRARVPPVQYCPEFVQEVLDPDAIP